MAIDIGDVRKAYGLTKGVRVSLKKPFRVAKYCPTWSHGDIRSLGHNHAYVDGGMPVGLVALEARVLEALVKEA